MLATLATIEYCNHALMRKAQRNFSDFEIDYVLLNGTHINEGSDDAFILRDRDIPTGERSTFGYLAGTKVILREGFVKTVFRNRVQLA